MSRMEKVNEVVQEHLNLIVFKPLSVNDSATRATKFLIVMAMLTDLRKDLELSLARIKTRHEAELSLALHNAVGKTVTEKKVDAGADPNYAKIREKMESIEASISWAKAYVRIFENAHQTYRIQTKE